MSALKKPLLKKEIEWTSVLIKMLRGKRTQTEFGRLIGVPKNTVWRWEAGYVKPDPNHSHKLSKLAQEELFLEDWQLVGSVKVVGDIEEGSKKIAEQVRESVARTSQQLAN